MKFSKATEMRICVSYEVRKKLIEIKNEKEYKNIDAIIREKIGLKKLEL